jgi:putative pre-16S rRNA nuclease
MDGLTKSVLALDLGAKRIGLSLASLEARLARPLTTLIVKEDNHWQQELEQIIEAENVTKLVVGYPRGVDGQTTAQTEAIEAMTEELKKLFKLSVDFQDEALTSVRAQQELLARGKTYNQADVDALAATYILEDWLSEHKNGD